MARENIDATVSLTDELSRPAGRAEDALDDLRRSVVELDAQLAASREETERQKKALDALTRSSRQQQTQNERSRRAADAHRKAMEGERRETERTAKAQKLLGLVFKEIKLTAIIAAVGYLAAAVSSLGAASFAAVAGLSPLVGVLGVMPGAVLSVVQAFGAAKIGTLGLSDALKVLMDPASDPAKVAEAMNKLTGEGRLLATVLANLARGPLARLRRETSTALDPGLVQGLREMRPLIPVVNNRLVDTATILGDLAAKAGDVAGSGFFRGQVARVMRSNNIVLKLGAGAAGFLGLALLDVADAARPVTEEVARAARSAAEYVAGATEAGRESGRLTAFFQRAWELAKDVGHVLGDVAVILYNVGSQSDVAAAAMGGGIIPRLEQLRDYTESITGKQAIADWFAQSLPVMGAFARLLGSVTLGFGKLSQAAELAPVIDQVDQELVPAFQDLGSTISADIAPALVDAATAAVKFLDTISNSPVPAILQIMAKGVLAIATAVDSLPGPVKFVLAAVLGLSFAIRATTAVAELSTLAFGGMAGGLTTVGGRAVSTTLQIGGLRGAMAGLNVAGGGLVSAMGGPWVVGIMAAVAALGLLATRNAQAKSEIDALRGTLDESGKATQDTVRKQLDLLDTNGWVEYADKIGVSSDTLVKALQGDQKALDVVKDKAHDVSTERGYFNLNTLTQDAEQFSSAVEKSSGKVDDARRKQELLNNASDAYSSSASSAAQSARQVEMSSFAAAGAMDTGRIAADRAGQVTTTSARVAERALTSQAHAARDARDALIALNDEVVGEQRTYIGFRQKVADAQKALRENAKTLDLNTQAGRDNKLQLIDVAEAATQVTNAAQRTKAIREARADITKWAEQAGYGETRAKAFSDSLFDLSKKAEALPAKAGVDVSVTGDLVALTQLGRIQSAINGLARPVQVGVVAPGTSYVDPRATKPARRDGGAVWPGQSFTVGEVGPELYVNASGVSVIGATGQESRRFSDVGWVLPNEAYERAAADTMVLERPTELPAVGRPGGGSGGDEGPSAPGETVELHNHFHGNVGGGVTLEDIERVSMATLRNYEREKRERG